MVEGLDELMVLIDSLWLSGLLTNRHRSEAAYQWQQRILRIARRIAAIESAVRSRPVLESRTPTLDEMESTRIAEKVTFHDPEDMPESISFPG